MINLNTKIINMRNNIFDIMRYNREEFLYLYNKTVDRLAAYSVKEIESMEEFNIFKEGIGSTDFKAFNIIKILNFVMKTFNPYFNTHEREIYVKARERFIEDRLTVLKERNQNNLNHDEILSVNSELLDLTMELKDNRIFYYTENEEIPYKHETEIERMYVSGDVTKPYELEKLFSEGEVEEGLKKGLASSIATTQINSNNALASAMNEYCQSRQTGKTDLMNDMMEESLKNGESLYDTVNKTIENGTIGFVTVLPMFEKVGNNG